jgi:hypothetical protein
VVSYNGSSAGSLPSVSVQSEREVVRTINTRKNIFMYSAWNTKDNYDMSASVFVVQFNGFMSQVNVNGVKYRY